MSKNDKPKLDLTKPIQRRNRCKVDFFRVLNGDRRYPIIAIGPDINGHDEFTTHQLDGRIGYGWDNELDLVNVPEKKTAWVYQLQSIAPGHTYFCASEARVDRLDKDCISRICIVFETGRKDE